MRVWLARAYGGPGVLVAGELPVPRPRAGEVLIRVEASTVSAADRRIRAMDFPRGLGLVGRAVFGFRRPRRPVLGVEATGIVVAVGSAVERFRPGDAVIALCGARMGAHAEYLLLNERAAMVPRPSGMALETAAALAFGGTCARDYLRRGALHPGERMLVIGASGTVGSAVVQLAAAAGARVTGVSSAPNLDLVRSLGAEEVIDYTTKDILATGERFDIVADAVGTLDFSRAQAILAEGGRYLAINGSVADMLARPRGSRRCIAGPAAERADDLAALVDLATAGRFRPLIDCILPFEAAVQAHARVDTGRKRGSVVLRLEEQGGTEE